jgi:uncharacterized protein YkwD
MGTMTRPTTVFSALALLCTFACDVDDETVTRSGEGVVGQGLAVDEADVDEAAEFDDDLLLDEIKNEDRPSYAYCDDVATWNSTWATLESQVLTLVNQRRAAGATCGGVAKPPVPALTLNTKLRCAARKHSKDMGTKNFFSHTGSNGSNFAQRIVSAGYTPWLALAENIAAGHSTAAAVVNGWMASTGHCNNIMNGNYKHLGVGYFYGATATYKHYWTQDFGKQ